jgi:hypothetical protein
VRPNGGHGGDGLLAVRRGADFTAQDFDELTKRIQHIRLIVHYEDTAAGRHGTNQQKAVTAPEFGLDPTSAPGRVLSGHTADQRAELKIERRATA